jgi:outer membrane protein assembly factor BamA
MKFLVVFLCSISTLIAQQSKTPVGVCKKETFRVLPIGYFTPETKLAAGGLFYYMFCFQKGDTITRRSSIQQYLTYTWNHQFLAETDWYIFSNKEKYFFSGDMDFSRFPEFFYGIGNNTKDSGQLYSFDRYKIGSKNQIKIGHHLFAGFQHQLQYLFNLKNNDSNLMTNMEAFGGNGFFINGLGGILTYDTRNNNLNATKGNYLELSMVGYHSIYGSQYDYLQAIVDVRKFIPVYKKTVLAFNFYASLTQGEVPFRAMPSIGGSRFLRGYYSGRFRDNNLLIFQTEYRGDLFWRLGFAVFGGIGRVAHQLKEFSETDWKYSLGAGLRFKINRKENVNVRLDYGYTGESHGLYIVFAEAF